MTDITLGRRDFIRIAALTALLGLSGCSFAKRNPTVRLFRGVLPGEFLRALETQKPWRYKYFDSEYDLAQDEFPFNRNDDLIVLGDGWLKHCPFELFQAIESPELYEHLNAQAMTFLNAFKFLINKSIALITLTLLSKKMSLHIISFEAAILEKSLSPPALYLIRSNFCIFSKS